MDDPIFPPTLVSLLRVSNKEIKKVTAKVSIIQHNNTQSDLPTFVAFFDYSTAYPSVRQGGMASLLQQLVSLARYGNTSVCGLTKCEYEYSTLVYDPTKRWLSSKDSQKDPA